MKNPSMLYLAEKIHAHLKRMEADETINVAQLRRGIETFPFYQAGANVAGSKLAVSTIGYHPSKFLTKAEAIEYLEWLDAGNNGSWYTMNNAKLA